MLTNQHKSRETWTPDYDLVINTFSRIWPRYEVVGFQGLTEAEKVIFCTWPFVAEVNNGGFAQFFSNSSGAFAVETLDALQKVRMPYAAALLRAALAEFPDATPAKDDHLRCCQLAALPQAIWRTRFNELTEAFFASREDAYALQAAFVRSNRLSFLAC